MTSGAKKRVRPMINLTLTMECQRLLSSLAEAWGTSRSKVVETLLRREETQLRLEEPDEGSELPAGTPTQS
jgi:hypothetical protein